MIGGGSGACEFFGREDAARGMPIMRILVTGATGQLGHYVVDELLARAGTVVFAVERQDPHAGGQVRLRRRAHRGARRCRGPR